MGLGAVFPFAREIWNFKNPINEVGETHPVYFSLVEVVAEALVKAHGYVFVVFPGNGMVIEIFERHFSSYELGGMSYGRKKLITHHIK
jgi:hypothetical protein